MEYNFENLNDERFQEFCSCLISKEYPDFQAFPVGQPDGGRDTIVYEMNSPKKEFIVFQVKYVKNPDQDRDIHKWLVDTIKGEIKKIKTLIPKGAKKYYLLTNLRGTAHLDVGAKDKVNKIFEENIAIPALCWWRDDLSRLFEKDPLFKWSFPEILNGQDILNSLLFQNLNENKERRENVIKAYLTDQYEIDNEVKFKQIDLQNKLLNLFTDVPVRIKKFNDKNRKLKHVLNKINLEKKILLSNDFYQFEERESFCAAEFILHPKTQSEIDKILLEGGPGQGKSTISQFVCQIHRVKLLNKTEDIKLIQDKFLNNPIRLPFKIDLRDVAAWVEKENPYQDILSQEYFDKIWKNSLEAFLVGHIYYHSKLEEFTSTDIAAVFNVSNILFVFDGFDEIARIDVRNKVIEFINKGVTRLSANSKSIQVIVTSRPAAFTDSVGFSIENYPHFELTDITIPIINEYLENWIKASKLDIRDANDLRKLIKEKMQLPHLKDLAKSPMQLAIFINLLRTKGQSLPNKRTALYDSYIDLFFDRESEKNTLIRDKRDLIIDIHQYLAWVLHSEAELLNNNGTIHINDLNSKLKEYLVKEGHNPKIADELFDVMKERVCALVSRVQGTFEFEVQPLREYFCAKYLYKSAPHSSAGSVKFGTKPDRLRAILRNYYWQNVVRFFAGCADAGELDMIIQELKDLEDDPILKYTNYPRIITAQILSDYVFTQKPHKLNEVVKIIINGINIGKIIDQDNRYSTSDALKVPIECGRTEIINECFSQLIKLHNNDYSSELLNIINNNPNNNLEIWEKYVSNFEKEKLTQWFNYAYKLKLIHKIDEKLLLKIINEDKEQSQLKERIQITINGNRLDSINNNIALKEAALDGILSNEIVTIQRIPQIHSFNFLDITTHPFILSVLFKSDDVKINFSKHLHQFSDRHSNVSKSSIDNFEVLDNIDKNIKSFSDSISGLLTLPATEFINKIEPWDILVENGRKIFGETLRFNVIAVIAAGIKSKEVIFDDYNNLNDNSISLCKRVRFARMKSGNINYWDNQLSNSENILFKLIIFFTWATPKTIIHFFDKLSKILKRLEDNDYRTLVKSISNSANNSTFNKTQQKLIEDELKNTIASDELKYLISLRIDGFNGATFNYTLINSFKGKLNNYLEDKIQYQITKYLKNPSDVGILADIKKVYSMIQTFQDRNYRRYNIEEEAKIPYAIAKKIMLDCKSYPIAISSLAEKACRVYANEHTEQVGKIAIRDKWFIDQ